MRCVEHVSMFDVVIPHKCVVMPVPMICPGAPHQHVLVLGHLCQINSCFINLYIEDEAAENSWG